MRTEATWRQRISDRGRSGALAHETCAPHRLEQIDRSYVASHMQHGSSRCAELLHSIRFHALPSIRRDRRRSSPNRTAPHWIRQARSSTRLPRGCCSIARRRFVRLGSRLWEKSRETRKRRIVFSIAVSRPRLPVQLVSVSMKLRQMFYTQIERRTFHTAWVKNGSVRARAARPYYPQEQISAGRPRLSRLVPK